VRKPLVKSRSPDIKELGNLRFVLHIFKTLNLQAAQYYSKAWRIPLAYVREHVEDIATAFKIAGMNHLCNKKVFHPVVSHPSSLSD